LIGVQRSRGGRPGTGCRGSACGAHVSVSSCICTPTPNTVSQRALLTVRHTCFVSGVERFSAVKGRATRTIPSVCCRILGCLHCLLARFEAADMHSSIAAPSAAVASLPMMLHYHVRCHKTTNSWSLSCHCILQHCAYRRASSLRGLDRWYPHNGLPICNDRVCSATTASSLSLLPVQVVQAQ